jgi:hypothetical protein
MEKGKFLFAILLVIAVALACNRSRNDENEDSSERKKRVLEKDEEKDESSETKIVYGNPYFLNGTPFAMVPLLITPDNDNILESFKREYLSPDKIYTSYSDRYNMFSYGDMYNVVFYNISDSSNYSLLNRKALINKFYMPSYREGDTSSTRFIIFTLIEEDYNNDDEIDDEDGETVYKCSIFGTDIRQISPDRIRLIDWEADESNDKILLYLTDDVNKDKKFDKHDETKILGTSISNSDIGKEILSDSVRNSMKTLYGK